MEKEQRLFLEYVRITLILDYLRVIQRILNMETNYNNVLGELGVDTFIPLRECVRKNISLFLPISPVTFFLRWSILNVVLIVDHAYINIWLM